MPTAKDGVLARPAETPAFLTQLSQIHHDLQAVVTVDEAVKLVRRADALSMLCRKANLEDQISSQAAEQVLWTKRRAGELLGESLVKHRHKEASHDASLKLDDLGINFSQSSRWQRIASVPVPVLRKHVEETRAAGKELTTASVLRLAAAPKPSRVNDRDDGSFNMVGALDRVRNWVRGLAEEFPEDDRVTLVCVLRKLADELEGFGVIA